MNSGRAGRWTVIAAFAAVYLIWGSTYLVVRFAIETLPPLLMAGVRFGMAGLALYIALRLRGEPVPDGRQMRNTAVTGALLLLIGSGGVAWAEQFIPSGIAALINATIPCWMVAFSALSGDKKPTVWDGLALALGATGVALLARAGEGAAVDTTPWAFAVVLIGSCSWALGSLFARRAEMPASPLMATALQMMFGGAFLSMASTISGETVGFQPEAVSLRSALALVYLIVFGSIVAFSAYVWLLRVVQPARVASYAYVNPLIAVLLGWLFGNEQLDALVGVAAALVVLAVVLITVQPAALSSLPVNVKRWVHSLRRNRVL